MANGERAIKFTAHEDNREQQFKQVWSHELNDVFADVAKYYDRANYIASLGLWSWFRKSFLSTISVQKGQKVRMFVLAPMPLVLLFWKNNLT